MKKAVRTIAVVLVLAVFLTGCVSNETPSTESADNATPGIEAVMHTIKDQDFETLAAFDSNGRLLFKTTQYEEGTVRLTSDQLSLFQAQDGALIIHNHPSGSTFSAVDLRAEAERGTRRAMVVTSDALYILEPGWRGWGDPEALAATYDSYGERFTQGAILDPNLGMPREITVWASHQALTATAEEFDLGYRRIPLKEVFCFHGIEVVTAG